MFLTTKENYYKDKVLEFLPSYDKEQTNKLILDKAFWQQTGKVLDDIQADVSDMHLFYWLVNDLIKVPIKNPDFKEFTPFDWEVIKQELELPIGQIQKEFYERINPFFGTNKVRCIVIDIDHAEDEITVDNNGLIEVFNIQETNANNINDIRLGEEISCSRMILNPDGVYGNKSTLLINRNQSLEIPEDFVIGVEQALPRKTKNKKISVKYKVRIKDDFIIGTSLDDLDNLFKPDGISDKKYLSDEAINLQADFAEYYTTPDFSNSYVFGYVGTTVAPGGTITGTEPYLRNGLVQESTNYITNFYDSFVTNFGFPANNETYNVDTKVLDFYFWTGDDENVPVMKTVNITFSGSKTVQELVDEINTAIIVHDPTQDFCEAEVEIVGIRQRPVIKSKYNLYISPLTSDSFSETGTLSSFTDNQIVLSSVVTQDDYYNGYLIEIFDSGSSGSSQIKQIIDYDGTSKTATLSLPYFSASAPPKNYVISGSFFGVQPNAFTTNEVVLSAEQISNKINNTLKNLNDFYTEPFGDGVLRFFSKDIGFELLDTNFANVNTVLGITAGVYETKSSIFATIRNDVLERMAGSITDNPQINIVSKLLRNTYSIGTFGDAKYDVSNTSSEQLYINKLDRYDDDNVGWQTIVMQMAEELGVENYMTLAELHDAFENYYQYYISQYNVWRSFEGLCYDYFDAFEITVSHGKTDVNLTEVVVDWIQNPYIDYIAQLLGWDIPAYALDLKLIDDTNLVRNLVHIYKAKGTHYAFEFLFKLMGFDVSVKELYRGFPLNGNFRELSGKDPRQNAFYDEKPFTGVYKPNYYNGPGSFEFSKWNADGWEENWDTTNIENASDLKKEAFQYLQNFQNNSDYRHGGGWYMNKSNRARMYIDSEKWRQITQKTMEVILRWLDFLKPIHIIWEDIFMSFEVLEDKITEISDSLELETKIELEDKMYYEMPVFYKDKFFAHKHIEKKFGIDSLSVIGDDEIEVVEKEIYGNTDELPVSLVEFVGKIVSIYENEYDNSPQIRNIIDYDDSGSSITLDKPLTKDLNADTIVEIVAEADKGIVINGSGRVVQEVGRVVQEVGTVDSATNNTVVLDKTITVEKNEDGNSLTWIVITAGKGVGQKYKVLNGDNETLTVRGTWIIVPDSTSEYAVVNDELTYYYDYVVNEDGEWKFDSKTKIDVYTGTTKIVKGFKFLYDGYYYEGRKRFYDSKCIDWIKDEMLFNPDVFEIFYGHGVVYNYNDVVAATSNTLTIVDGNTDYIEHYVVIEDGEGNNQIRKIINVISNILAVDSAWDVIPSVGDKYAVVAKDGFAYADFGYITKNGLINNLLANDKITLPNALGAYGGVTENETYNPDGGSTDPTWQANRFLDNDEKINAEVNFVFSDTRFLLINSDDYALSNEHDFYNGQTITCNGLKRKIIDYEGTTKTVTIDSAWTILAPDKVSITNPDYIFGPFVYDEVKKVNSALIPLQNKTDGTTGGLYIKHPRWDKNKDFKIDLIYENSQTVPLVFDIDVHSEYFGKTHDVYYSKDSDVQTLWPLFVKDNENVDKVKDGLVRKMITPLNVLQINDNLLSDKIIDWADTKTFKFVIWTYGNYGKFATEDKGVPTVATDLQTKAQFFEVSATNLTDLIKNTMLALKEVYNCTDDKFSSGTTRYFKRFYGRQDFKNFMYYDGNNLILQHYCDFMVLPNELNKVLGIESNSYPKTYEFNYYNVIGTECENLQFTIENNAFSRWRNEDDDVNKKYRRYLRYDQTTFEHSYPDETYSSINETFKTYAFSYFSKYDGTFKNIKVVNVI